jgi:hypothetical protein
MICFCGDSYAADEGGMKPNQWYKQLAKKLYGEDHMSKHINFATGGKCNDHIIEDQLIRGVLNRYPDNPFEYLVIGFTYWERFKISNTISWTPAQGMYGDVNKLKEVSSNVLENNKLRLDRIGSDEEISKFLDASIRNSMILNEDTFIRRKSMIVSLLDLIKRFGTKLLIYDNHSNSDTPFDMLFYNLDDYCEKINISLYANSLNEKEYSNHFSIESNMMIAEAFYKEIINK